MKLPSRAHPLYDRQMSEEDEVQYKVQGRVAIVCMNRPDVLNAMTTSGFGLLRQAFGRAEADPNVVGGVLTGEGRGFCAGLDMVNLSGLSDGADIDMGRDIINNFKNNNDSTTNRARPAGTTYT